MPKKPESYKDNGRDHHRAEVGASSSSREIPPADRVRIQVARGAGEDPHRYFVREQLQVVREIEDIRKQIETVETRVKNQPVFGRASQIDQIGVEQLRAIEAEEGGLLKTLRKLQAKERALDTLLAAMQEGEVGPAREELRGRGEDVEAALKKIEKEISEKLEQILASLDEERKDECQNLWNMASDLRGAAAAAKSRFVADKCVKSAEIFEDGLGENLPQIKHLLRERQGLLGRQSRLMERERLLDLYERFGGELAA